MFPYEKLEVYKKAYSVNRQMYQFLTTRILIDICVTS